MTSAIWKITERPCRTILAPIFTNRSRSVVSDQCFTEIVGQRMRLQLNGVGREAMVRQCVRMTAFLPSLIHCSAVPR